MLKVLERKIHPEAEIHLHLNVSRRLMFCTQTNTDECRRMQTHTCRCRRMQTHMDTHRWTQMQTCAHRGKWTSLDERRANCIQCVGRCNLKTRPDVRHLFKDFWDVLYISHTYYPLNSTNPVMSNNSAWKLRRVPAQCEAAVGDDVNL